MRSRSYQRRRLFLGSAPAEAPAPIILQRDTEYEQFYGNVVKPTWEEEGKQMSNWTPTRMPLLKAWRDAPASPRSPTQEGISISDALSGDLTPLLPPTTPQQIKVWQENDLTPLLPPPTPEQNNFRQENDEAPSSSQVAKRFREGEGEREAEELPKTQSQPGSLSFSSEAPANNVEITPLRYQMRMRFRTFQKQDVFGAYVRNRDFDDAEIREFGQSDPFFRDWYRRQYGNYPDE
jgi:hypothetical protein